MPWRPLDNPKSSEIGPEFRGKTKFLIDESLGIEVAEYLRDKGYNAVFTGHVGLNGHSDEDIFAYAWRETRMLWTHDRDFLDESRFPEHRNPRRDQACHWSHAVLSRKRSVCRRESAAFQAKDSSTIERGMHSSAPIDTIAILIVGSRIPTPYPEVSKLF